MEKGYITTQVVSARGAIPIAQANVFIEKKNGNGMDLVSVQKTDSSGRTINVEVDTPDRILSESPGNTAPFAVFDIIVTYPSFYTVVIHDVQVFSNEVTLQQVEMIPLPENFQSQNNTFTFDVPPQNL